MIAESMNRQSSPNIDEGDVQLRRSGPSESQHDTNSMEAQPESGCCHDRRKRPIDDIIALVRPWVTIVTVAIIAALYYSTFQTQSQEGQQSEVDDSSMTSPEYTNGRNLVEVFLQTHPHPHPIHHKPVFNEDHKPLFPLSTADYYGFALAILGLMIAAGGGIGGGGILVPIYILVMGFSPKHAIPLSNITVLGGSLANTVLNVRKRHPLADRPLIDWDLILVMEPFTVAGALIGAVLNKVLPEVMLSVLLVMLLSVTAWTSLKKAVKMYQKETQQMIAAKESELTKLGHDEDVSEHEEAENGLLKNMEVEQDDGNTDTKKSTVKVPSIGDRPEKSLEIIAQEKDLEKILTEERTANPNNIIILSVMFAVVLSVNVLKGGGAFPSPLGIRCGSTEFWFANIFLLGWILAVAVFVRQYLVNRYHRKKLCGYPYVEGDIQWDERTTVIYPFICCFAGFFAGMFGIGKLFGLIRTCDINKSNYCFQCLHRTSFFLLTSIFFVSQRRRNCERSINVGARCAPCNSSRIDCRDDIFHCICSSDVLYCLRFADRRLCSTVSPCWICFNVSRTSGSRVPDAKERAKFVHRF